jgi:TP901 family phage tail tape measure protein
VAETIKGINVVIGAETTGLQKALADVNKHSKDIQSELKQVERLLKLDPSNTELLAQKQKLLSDAVETTKEKLNRLRDAQSQVAEQFAKGEISEGQYRAFQRELIKTEEELKKFEEQLKKSSPILESFGEKAKAAGEKISNVGSSLTKYVTAPLAAAGAGLVAVGNTFDEAFDKIRIGTGATGKALESLQDDFRAVAKEVPANFGDISTAIADYNTRLGMSGEELQNLSKQTLELVRITGGDLATTIEETSQSFKAFNLDAKDYGEGLDFIFKVSQSTGIGITRLQQNLVKFAPALKQLGLGFKESATLMGQLDKAGVDVEQTLSGLTKAIANMAKEGITDANEAIRTLFEKIKDAPSDMAATQAALDVFGAKAGPALATAIREGKLEYQALLEELQGSSETILGVADETKDWAEGLMELKNNILLALEPIAGKFFDAMNKLIPLVKSLVEFIIGLVEKFAALSPAVQTVILALAGFLAAAGPVITIIGQLITFVGAASTAVAGMGISISALSAPIAIGVAAVVGLIAVIADLWKNNEEFRNNVITLWNELVQALKYIWSVFGDDIKAITKMIFDILQSIITTFTMVVTNIIKAFLKLITGDWKGAWEAMIEALKGFVTGVYTIITTLVDTIKTIFSKLIEDMFQIGKDIVTGLWNGIQSMASWIYSKVSSFVDGIIASAKGMLGIKSPSKVFAEIGENISQGLAIGIENGALATQNAIANLVEELKRSTQLQLPNVEPGVVSGSTVNTVGREIIQNITVQSPEPLSPSETARQIKNASRLLALEW